MSEVVKGLVGILCMKIFSYFSCLFTVIIEEAAEILESHTVTAITNHCQHLILIGKYIFIFNSLLFRNASTSWSYRVYDLWVYTRRLCISIVV